jgi:hypothetical protein
MYLYTRCKIHLWMWELVIVEDRLVIVVAVLIALFLVAVMSKSFYG